MCHVTERPFILAGWTINSLQLSHGKHKFGSVWRIVDSHPVQSIKIKIGVRHGEEGPENL